MKELFIIRHGEAEMASSILDPALTPQGLKHLERVREWVAKLPSAPELILCSSLRRARETTEQLNLFWNAEVQIVDWLRPGVFVGRVLEELKSFPQNKIAVVGHLPSLGWLLSVLVWGLPARDLILERGSVTWLKVKDWEAQQGEVLATNYLWDNFENI